MKKLVLAFAVAGLAGGAAALALNAADRARLSREEVWSVLSGVWSNSGYSGLAPYLQKLVIRPDHVGVEWSREGDSRPMGAWRLSLRRWWTDWRGRLCCQVHGRWTLEEFAGNDVAALVVVDRRRARLEMQTIYAAPVVGRLADWVYRRLERTDPDWARLHSDMAVYRVYERR